MLIKDESTRESTLFSLFFLLLREKTNERWCWGRREEKKKKMLNIIVRSDASHLLERLRSHLLVRLEAPSDVWSVRATTSASRESLPRPPFFGDVNREEKKNTRNFVFFVFSAFRFSFFFGKKKKAWRSIASFPAHGPRRPLLFPNSL